MATTAGDPAFAPRIDYQEGMEIEPGTTRLGWIGLGVMGSPMCRHLMEAGFDMTLHTRSPEKADGHLAMGADWAHSPREVARASDVVFTMVGYPSEVREVILADDGVLSGVTEGGVVVDMTTSEPSLAVEISEAAAIRGATAVDAPVSGGDLGAREATLSIMIGGNPQTVTALRPCWEAMGDTFVHQGAAGAGQHAKMVNQTLVAAGMVGVCEALLYAHRAGLDLHEVLRSVSSGAAASWALSNLGPRIIDGDYRPGFYVEHFIKDMGIALAEAERMNLAMPGLALVRQLYQAVAAQGHSRSGTQSLVVALAQLCGIDWPPSP